MKAIITVLLCAITMNGYSQPVEIGYMPEQREGVTNKRYQKAKKTLERVYKNLKKEYKLTQNTYWNLAASFNYMGEQPEKVYDLLVRAKKVNPANFCIVMDVNLNGRDAKTSLFYENIGDKFLDLIASCNAEAIKPLSLEEMMVKKESLNLLGLNEPLIDRLIRLMEKDNRYRGRSIQYARAHKEAFIKLDAEVRIELVKIFETYGYAGKDIVGEYYQNYMCLLLEHVGELEAQEKYLPVVANAYKNKQLKDMPLKMLIDRVYSTKTKTQIFGSHGDYPYAHDTIINKVKEHYGFTVVKPSSVITMGSEKIMLQKN